MYGEPLLIQIHWALSVQIIKKVRPMHLYTEIHSNMLKHTNLTSTQIEQLLPSTDNQSS